MKQFYARLLAGDTKDVAIEKAGEAIRAKYPHPFYWAPFVLDGDYK
jgi:CHAT domain-containing protein